MNDEVILRFDEASFEYTHAKPILSGASFSIHRSAKITLMGQNGAGKSSIFALIMGELTPQTGQISITGDASIATARQVVAREDLDLTVTEYFAKAFTEPQNDIQSKIFKFFKKSLF